MKVVDFVSSLCSLKLTSLQHRSRMASEEGQGGREAVEKCTELIGKQISIVVDEEEQRGTVTEYEPDTKLHVVDVEGKQTTKYKLKDHNFRIIEAGSDEGKPAMSEKQQGKQEHTEAGKETVNDASASVISHSQGHKQSSLLPTVSMAALKVLDSAKNPMWIMTFEPGFVRYVWANEACQESHQKKLEDMVRYQKCYISLTLLFHLYLRDFVSVSILFKVKQDLEKDASVGMKRRHDVFFKTIQCQEKVMGPTLQTIYPGGIPKTYELVMSPLRVHWNDVTQTVVLVNAYEKKKQDMAVEHELKRAIEMQRHSSLLTMLFKCSDGTMLAFSPSAHEFYNRYAYFQEKNMFKDQTLKQLLRFSTPADGAMSVQEILTTVKGMTRTDMPIEIEVTKTPYEGSNRIRWFRLTFVPISDPATGENVVSVTEVEITAIKEVQDALKLKETQQLEFFHHIVHELRTPLHGIINILEQSIKSVPGK